MQGIGVLMVPGFTGSGPGHWQTLWQRQHPAWERLEQDEWDRPDPHKWTRALDKVIRASARPVVLAAHSLGCVTIARWAESERVDRVAGAFLVAPSDVEASTAPPEIAGFAPVPQSRLPFPSVVVASTNDPFVTLARARNLAECWGGQFVPIESAGHINTASGHGPWPEGLSMFTTFLEGLVVPPHAV